MSEKVYKPKYTPTEIMTMIEKVVCAEMNAKPSWEKDDKTDWVLTRTTKSEYVEYGASDDVVHELILTGCSKKTAGRTVILSFKENPWYVVDYFDKDATLLVGYMELPDDADGRAMRDEFKAPFTTMDVIVDGKQVTSKGIEDVRISIYSTLNPVNVDGCYLECKQNNTLDLKNGLWNPAQQLGLFDTVSQIDLEYVFALTMYKEWLNNDYYVTSIVDAKSFPYGRYAKNMGFDWVPDNADDLRFYKLEATNGVSEPVIIGVDKLNSDNIRVYNPYVRDSNNEPVFTRLCVNQSEELLPEVVRGFEIEKGDLTPTQRQSIVDVSYMNDDDTDFQYITSVPEGLKGTDTIQVDVHEFLEGSKSLYVTKVRLTDKEDFFRVREAFDIDNVPEKIESYGTFDSLIEFKRAYEKGLEPTVVHVGVRKEKEEPVVEDDGFELE